MTAVVVDSSVVIKWYVDEDHSEAAQRLLTAEITFHAPEFLLLECASILWKKVRRGHLLLADASAILHAVEEFPFQLHNSRDLIEAAWRLATAADRTIYDSIYCALGMTIECPFVTADTRLVNALASAAFPVDIRHVTSGDFD
jgi:predicted nucleic acid-binding protein